MRTSNNSSNGKGHEVKHKYNPTGISSLRSSCSITSLGDRQTVELGHDDESIHKVLAGCLQQTRLYPVLEAVFKAGQLAAEKAFETNHWKELEKMVDELPIGFYCTEPDGNILVANKRLVSLLAYPNKTALKRATSNAFYLDSQERTSWKQRVDKKGVEEDYRVFWRQFDGTPILIRNRTRVVYNEQGKVRCYQGVVEDITPYAEVHSGFAPLFTKLSMASIEVNSFGNIAWMNQAAAQLLGYESPNPLAGQHLASFIRPRDFARLEKDYDALLAGRVGVKLPPVITLATCNQGFIPACLNYVLLEKRGINIGMLITLENRSVQRDFTAALKLERDDLEVFANLLPFPLFIKGKKHRFKFVNEMFAQELGRPRDQIIGKGDADFFPNYLLSKYWEDDDYVIRRKIALETIELHKPPNQQLEYVQVVKIPQYDETGEIVGVIGAYWPESKREAVLAALGTANPS